MGIIEIINNNTLSLHAHIVCYGNAANAALTERIRDEIETMWNEPGGIIYFRGSACYLQFRISALYCPALQQEEVSENDNPANNYFRIEEKAGGNISFVDGLGSNTGYFQADNLYEGSTTAAHEYGHTLGLPHPHDLDFRGKGVPGIMYPRGTLVDPPFQYDAAVPAGQPGGTMHPVHRKVRKEDIAMLKPEKLFKTDFWIIGAFSSQWHEAWVPDKGA